VIKVSVMYPNGAGTTFDMAYYLGTHMPLVKRLAGAALRGQAVEEGLSGAAPGSPAAYMAMGHLLFDSVTAFQEVLAAHGPAIMADVPNYTNSAPVLQVSEVKL
jgi:uncharacterized protein (TIGR02118 family)